MRLSSAILGPVMVLVFLGAFPELLRAAPPTPRPQASLQSYTGIWDMPTARVLPDWRTRLKFGYVEPFRYYGGAVGLFDRFEIHGQFTEVDTLVAFPGEGYGYYKDRSAGARLVLMKEGEVLPQVAIGAFDATGTALFGSRYIVASKMWGDFDFTFGLGQGVLAGEFVRNEFGPSKDIGFDFLLSDPFRRTRPFGGVEWHLGSGLTLAAEYSAIDNDRRFGYVDGSGIKRVSEDDSRFPVNIGLKYQMGRSFYAQAGLAGGSRFFFGVGLDFDLAPGEVLGWRKRPAYRTDERTRSGIALGPPQEAAQLVAQELYEDGFAQVKVDLGYESVWVEAASPLYLSDGRAVGRMGEVLDALLPPRIQTFYLSLRHRHQSAASWQVKRCDLIDFMQSRIDEKTLLAFSQLDLYTGRNRADFLDGESSAAAAWADGGWYNFSITPRIRTFLNNRAGFFKHKISLQNTLTLKPWQGAELSGTLEVPIFNQYEDLVYPALEKEAARTDVKLYEQRKSPHLTQLSFDQIMALPGGIYGRASAGLFEAAYAGFGGELFRFFNEGRLGIGLEAQAVRKRDLDDDFALSDTDDSWRTPAYVNLYAQLWPEQGIDAGIKIGRFLAGDVGARIEMRRTFRYFTLGAWYTKTDTSVFSDPQNVDAEEKGVYITFPLAFFGQKESRQRASYAITTFTLDQGQMVAQPRSLFPINPFGTPVFLKQTLKDMRD